MRSYFVTSGAAGADQEDVALDSAAAAEWLRDADGRRGGPVQPDNPAEIRRRIATGA
jgi:hypothetical protein